MEDTVDMADMPILMTDIEDIDSKN